MSCRDSLFNVVIWEHTLPKKELFMVLPYLGKPSLCLRTRLQKSMNSNISFCKIKIISKSSKRLANFFRFKDKIPLCLRCNIVYKFTCGRCNATYYGETCRHFKVRVGEHSGISPLTNKRSKSKKSTAVKNHSWFVTNQFLLTTLKCLLLVTLSSIWKSKKVS